MLTALVTLAAAAALAAVLALRAARVHARALAELRRGLEVELEARTLALRRAEEGLHRAEKLAAVGQFAAGVAHTLNGPAAAVGATLRYLRDAIEPGKAAPPDVAPAIDDAEAALARIATVLRQLRDASRLATLPARADAATAVDRAVREAVEVLRARAGGALGTVPPVELDVPGDLWVAAEPDVVIEVVAALLANALDATAGGETRVRVSARSLGATVRLAVEDDGPGMAPEVLRRVFEPFFTTKDGPHAAGLGLAVSRGLVASTGGDLWLESAPGKGTRALVVLPAIPPPAIATATTPAPLRPR